MKLTLAQIDEGIDALLRNAGALIVEAELLLAHRAFARAHALAHLAREELSKVAMLHAAGVRVLAEHPVDWNRLGKRFLDHKSKLRQEIVENLLLMKAHGFKVEQSPGVVEHVVTVRNKQKNDALYVGFADGHFDAPADVITEAKAARTTALARIRLTELEGGFQGAPAFRERGVGSLSGMPRIDELLGTLDDEALASFDLDLLADRMRPTDGSQ